MTVTVKLITEQTTNQLVDSVNKAQAEGWFPVCGVVCFNARYTQLMALDTDHTEVPKCNYFIVDSEDGVDFAQRVNRLIALNTGAVCLSSVQYEQARYIQAWGDDSLHSGSGGGALSRWYTENATKTGPIIDTDTNLPEIGLGNEWAGYLRLIFRTGGNSAGYIHADDGTLTLRKVDGSELNIMDDDVNMQVKGISVFNSSGGYTNLIAQGAGVTLAPGFAGITSPAGALELDETRGIKLYGNGGVNSVIDADPTQATFGDNAATTNINGDSLVLDANGKGTLEMDANALRVKRGANQLFSISDAGGTMTWNSMIRCAWNADGWNVSRDNGVSFTSRATLAAMIGPNGSRVEANNTGLTLTSTYNASQQSKLTMLNGEIKGYVTSPTEPFLVADALNTTLRYVGNELKLSDSNNVTLNSEGNDVILNALAGNVTFNALGQSMSVGPAGLRYTVDGVDVIQSGSTTSRSAPDLTIHRPGGGDMMLDMTANSARLQSSATSYVDVANAGVSTKIGNTLLNVADNGMVTVSTNVDTQAPNLWLAQYTAGQGHSVAPTGDNPQQQYLVIGGREWGVGSVKGIGFGYEKAATDWAPAFVGYRETNSSGATGWGDLFFATRNVNTNTQPTERLRITSTGQITAAAGYTPVVDSDLATKKYVDNAATTTVGTYNASGTSAVAVVPGKDVYYSSVASAGGGLTMYAPTAGKPDVTIAAPSHAAIVINAPSGVLLRRGATTANLITIPPSTNCRFVALSDTEWLVMPSGGAS